MDEVHRLFTVGAVHRNARGNRWGFEVVERQECLHGRVFASSQVLQEEELHVSPEIPEEIEESPVTGEYLAHRACLAEVVAADALQREVHPVADRAAHAAAGLVDGPLPIDLVTGEDHHAAHGVAQCDERFDLAWVESLDDVLQPHVVLVGRDY